MNDDIIEQRKSKFNQRAKYNDFIGNRENVHLNLRKEKITQYFLNTRINTMNLTNENSIDTAILNEMENLIFNNKLNIKHFLRSENLNLQSTKGFLLYLKQKLFHSFNKANKLSINEDLINLLFNFIQRSQINSSLQSDCLLCLWEISSSGEFKKNFHSLMKTMNLYFGILENALKTMNFELEKNCFYIIGLITNLMIISADISVINQTKICFKINELLSNSHKVNLIESGIIFFAEYIKLNKKDQITTEMFELCVQCFLIHQKSEKYNIYMNILIGINNLLNNSIKIRLVEKIAEDKLINKIIKMDYESSHNTPYLIQSLSLISNLIKADSLKIIEVLIEKKIFVLFEKYIHSKIPKVKLEIITSIYKIILIQENYISFILKERFIKNFLEMINDRNKEVQLNSITFILYLLNKNDKMVVSKFVSSGLIYSLCLLLNQEQDSNLISMCLNAIIMILVAGKDDSIMVNPYLVQFNEFKGPELLEKIISDENFPNFVSDKCCYILDNFIFDNSFNEFEFSNTFTDKKINYMKIH